MLKRRFKSLWQRCGNNVSTEAADAVCERVFGYYSEPQRHYHDLGHIALCIAHLDEAKDVIPEPDEIEMAIWFHDVVYDIDRDDNEARSAEFFRWRAVEANMDGDFIEEVVDLIMATTHIEHVDSDAQAFLVDIDLSSFGLPWVGFIADTEALREESIHTPDEEYYAGKLRFYSYLEIRDRIYYTDWFRDICEVQARENIKRYSAMLREQGFSA